MKSLAPVSLALALAAAPLVAEAAPAVGPDDAACSAGAPAQYLRGLSGISK